MKKDDVLIKLICLAVVAIVVLTGCRPGTTASVVIEAEDDTPTPEIEPTTKPNTPTPEPMTPTPKLTIWSESFDSESLEGWETWWQDGEFYVEDGVLTSTVGGDLKHESSILIGTWSFDLLLDENTGTTHEFRFTEGGFNFQNMEVKQYQNTQIWITTQRDGAMPIQTYWDLAEKITGWHHFDITKDESGLIKVFMDGELLFGHFDSRSFDCESLVIMYCCSGPVLDNLIVQDQVIELPSGE